MFLVGKWYKNLFLYIKKIVASSRLSRKKSAAETISLGSNMSSIATMIATIANLSK